MKKDSIRLGGLKVFAHKGFEQASMDDIAAEAGVAKGTLYYHYVSKEALYEDIVAVGLKHLMEVLEAAREGERAPNQRLQAVIDENLRYLGENRDFCMLLATSASGALQMREALFTSVTLYFDYLENHLREMQTHGVLQSELDLQATAAAMFGLVLMVAVRCHQQSEPVFTVANRRTVLLMSQGALGFTTPLHTIEARISHVPNAFRDAAPKPTGRPRKSKKA